MPKLNPVGIALATVAFFFVGFLWYGVIFAEAWMAAEGVTEDEAGSPVWMLPGLLITAMQVIGLACVLNWKGAAGLGDALKTTVLLWALFALPFCAYGYLYNPAHNLTLLMIDASHLLVGWSLAAIVLSRFK